MDSPTNQNYNPNFLDALRVFWSFTWRTAVLNLVITLPLVFILHYLGLLPAFMKIKEGAQIPTPTFHEKLVLNVVISPLQILVGYLALRDLIKAKYQLFVFDLSQITGKDLLLFSIIFNAFSTIFSFFAGNNLETSSPLNIFLFLGINIFVSCALLQHVMSSGFFKGKWRVHLPLLPRQYDE